ncbi:MAG TPA: ABC transporter permease [Thermoanaerobaculia bacterium]|nr:ABC transporter permease [Thermoanaerobaculia bacterium]
MTAPPIPPSPRGWGLWRRQVLAILRLELRKGFFGRRGLWLYLLALGPVAIPVLFAIVSRGFPAMLGDPTNVGRATLVFAHQYQEFILRIVIFLACVAIFGNLIRREMLDRSLHYYLLAPVRREILLAAKFLAGALVAIVLFGASTLASFLLTYLPYDTGAVERFMLNGPGPAHLGAYLLVTVLACLGYGAVFLAFGFFFKSPAVPALLVFGWESIHFLLPPLLKKISVIHYLQSLCPVPLSQGPFALLSDAPPRWAAAGSLLLLAAALLALSAQRIRRLEISYEED